MRFCVKEAAGRAGVKVEDIQSAIVGNVIRTKSKDAYISRMIAIEAGMSIESHAVTVNRLCGSGLEAIVNAGTQQIQTGEVKLAVAGGAEVMSQATFSSASPRDGQRMGSLAFEDDLLATLSDPFGAGHMGMTAEKVGQFEISREDQDAFAAESSPRCACC